MNKIKKALKNSLLNLPVPLNISYWWNFGSLLAMFLGIQFISGFLLSIHYCPNTTYAFYSIIHIIQNVNNGWMMHNIHINGASFFFICMYTHIARGIYYESYTLNTTWAAGVTIFLIAMATAFLGYVLPWGQMSFWGATVITNLISTIPYIGNMTVMWVWGGFSINNATLNRFFSLHFILPFILTILIILHLYFLHMTGSNNPLGINSNMYKVPFHIYFSYKDLLGFMMFLFPFTLIILKYPYMFSDPDNFTPANPMVTPIHIQPEWYFLFAYAILRSIPNKLGGVIALLSSILILYMLPLHSTKIQSMCFSPINQIFFWMFINIFIMLTWAGAQPIENPYMYISQMLSMLYFIFFIMTPSMYTMWSNIIYK
uniref:cytochrome b n=1 Tax=Aphaenogaster japonica TaxID=602661 RepID=UPI001EDCA43C|nr:cytochrome b [Aphaenogaster japonica]UHY39323.1 cytochrome b [Aphaenogaster japonica]